MARWLSIKVELISGRGEDFWPRPGRVIAAAGAHTFAQLASAIDLAFARWDLAHLSEFRFADGTRIGQTDWDDTDTVIDGARTKLSRLRPGDQFVYEFDFGDSWTHLLTVADKRVDPLDELGIVPRSRRRTGVGARCPTSTDAASRTTTAKVPSRRTPA